MKRFSAWPLWIYFPVGLVLLFGGLWAIGILMGVSDDATDPKADLLRKAPLWVLVLVPIGEAFLWTVVFTEGLARALRAPVAGAIVGVLAYGLLFHASSGLLGILASAWIGVVCNGLYLVMRGRSRWAGFATVVGLRWAFIAYAYVKVGGLT